jgi:YfiR/HmsC-like
MSTQFKINELMKIKSMMKLLTELTQLFFTASMILLLSPFNSYANEKNLEYKVKAAYLYNFTKFVHWPDNALPATNEKPLNICILGQDPFGHAIDLLFNKKAQGHSVAVEYIDKANTNIKCHVVFIAKSNEKNIDKILKVYSNENILTVSDIEKFAVKGGCISLNVLKGKVRFNVNLQATHNANLKVSAKLLELAKMVIE